MILVREVTNDWVGNVRPNHTYLMDDKMNKVLGYFKWHNPNDFELCKFPITIDRRYRKFQILQTGYKFANETPNTKTWEIAGSGSNKYLVSQDDMGYNCSCIGFKYHGKCKHIEQVKNESK